MYDFVCLCTESQHKAVTFSVSQLKTDVTQLREQLTQDARLISNQFSTVQTDLQACRDSIASQAVQAAESAETVKVELLDKLAATAAHVVTLQQNVAVLNGTIWLIDLNVTVSFRRDRSSEFTQTTPSPAFHACASASPVRARFCHSCP